MSKFIKGMDLSTLLELERCGAKYYEDGKEKDILDIMKEHDVDTIRIRLWNDPKSEDGEPYGAGNNDLAETIAIGKKVTDAGFGVLLNFHYSDFWADPGKQIKPKAWKDFGVDELEQAVYDFTLENLTKIIEAGVNVTMIQVGNELSNGLLWPEGEVPNYDNIAKFVNAGIRACRKVNADIPIMIHLDNGGNNELYVRWFTNFIERGEEFDYIGLSYYPFWHGSLDQLEFNMNDIAKRFNKDLIIAEVSMGFTMDSYKEYEKLSDSERKGYATKPELVEKIDYPMTIEGQADFTKDFLNRVANVVDDHGKGFFWWEPAWIPVPGSGWATPASLKYMNDPGPCGNEWANQALFDYDGNMLPAIKDMVRNDLDEDTPLECLVMGWTKYKGRETYLGISAQGDPVNIVTESTKLSKGDYVVATYMSMEPTGRLLCRYNRPVDEDFNTFSPHDAIRTMLFLLKSSVFHIPETMDLASENTDDDLPESTIEPEHVVELIHIIDRVGSLESSYLRRFNYMAFARMLARLIDNNGLVQYYARRMSFVRRLRTFVSSGYINVDDIRADEENSGDYPVLEMRSRQLRILSYIYDSSKNDFLWDIIAGDYDETSVGLAKLALTANLSMEMDVDEAQGAITGRISQLLNIEVKIQQPIFLGEETQTLEFKSSYICPEDGLHIDMPRQRDHILQRICGFLNSAQGGKLYIGVNRYGYVVGNDDLYHHLFGGDRDKYELRVRNDIRINLGGAANDCISTLWLDPAESGGKNVFVVEIRPNQFGTEYGGKYWVRQGTSTYPYTRKEFLAMQANRTLADAQ